MTAETARDRPSPSPVTGLLAADRDRFQRGYRVRVAARRHVRGAVRRAGGGRLLGGRRRGARAHRPGDGLARRLPARGRRAGAMAVLLQRPVRGHDGRVGHLGRVGDQPAERVGGDDPVHEQVRGRHLQRNVAHHARRAARHRAHGGVRRAELVRHPAVRPHQRRADRGQVRRPGDHGDRAVRLRVPRVQLQQPRRVRALRVGAGPVGDRDRGHHLRLHRVPGTDRHVG